MYIKDHICLVTFQSSSWYLRYPRPSEKNGLVLGICRFLKQWFSIFDTTASDFVTVEYKYVYM